LAETDPIPVEFSQGNDPAFVVIFDQSARPYRAPVELGPIEPQEIPATAIERKTEGGLLDKRDPIARDGGSRPRRARLPHAQSARAAIALSEGPAAFLRLDRFIFRVRSRANLVSTS
jgi:hypothetical protein